MDYEKLNDFLAKSLQVEHHNMLIKNDEDLLPLFNYIYSFYNEEEIGFAYKDSLRIILRNSNVIDLKQSNNKCIIYHDILRLGDK